jgi:hypothetical protein
LFSIKLNRIHAEDIRKNKLSIQRQYSASHLQGSVATSWLSLYWSDKNKIEPYFLPIGSSHKCWFRCPYGATFYASPNFLMSKIKEPSLEQNNDKCVFDNANMCDRAIKVQKGLKLTVLDSASYANDVLEIKFSIENSNDVSFDPLQIWQYFVFCNDKFYSFNGALGEIERTSYAFVNQSPTETCELKYNSCCGKHDFQIAPFSKNIFTVKVKLKTQFKECKLDVFISINLLDQMNWVYKVCLHTKYHDSIMTTSGEILTWKMHDEIAQIKDSSLRHFLKEDEAKRLILEI